ncbi:MAG: hypothetical protein QOH39_561 [Verrucomicrobiota bacterium]|jgi:hypothetical protein
MTRVIKVKRTIRPKKLIRPTSRISVRELTRHYFKGERHWQFAIELFLFALIAIISAWPIFLTAQALNELLQRTAG